MKWTLTDKGDQRVRRLADRHYSRRTPGSTQFTAPGCNLVLRGERAGCFKLAGFRFVGRTEGGHGRSPLDVLQLGRTDFPEPEPPLAAQLDLLEVA